MTWRMPAETAPHERTWMAFPRPGLTLGDDPTSAEEAYARLEPWRPAEPIPL